MKEFFQFVLSNIWVWLGFIIILITIFNFFLKIYALTLRAWNIRKHGYPENCDADGDFRDIKEEKLTEV